MADFNVSTVASQINPPQTTSIGDMLNVARGAQAYQQAQQVNPFLAQKAQTESEQAALKLQSDQNAIINQSLTALMQDPNVRLGKDKKAIEEAIAEAKKHETSDDKEELEKENKTQLEELVATNQQL